MFALIKAFIAGFVATLTFHQGLLWLLDRARVISSPPWNMAAVPPFGVPAVISLAFWGGLWGLVVWLLVRNAEAAGYYVGAIILGAILPTLVGLTIVPLAHGVPASQLADALSLAYIGLGLALNGFWALGVAVFMRLMHPPR